MHGRGSSCDLPNRFETVHLDVLPDGGGSDDLIHEFTEIEGEQRRITTQVYRDHSRSILNPVNSPDLGFRWTINPYRGCEHGCSYCYARPTHEMLGLSCGLDFETKIFAKTDAVRILLRELARPSWQAESIMLSGVTDAYQPIERHMGITRDILELLCACRQPVSIVTKSALILRDLDLLREMAHARTVRVAVSLTTLDAALSAQMEPRAASPAQRLRTIRELSQAGVPVVVMAAPIIPGLTDRELPALLKAGKEHGAVGAGYILLRLPWQLKELFLDWLSRTQHPDRAKHVESLIRQSRGGKLYDSTLGKRHVGDGPFAQQIRDTFDVFSRQYGLSPARSDSQPTGARLDSSGFRPPNPDGEYGQMQLFGMVNP